MATVEGVQMTPPITDARREEILKFGGFYLDTDGVSWTDFDSDESMLTWGELRALLAERTCEWTKKCDIDSEGMILRPYYGTECGRTFPVVASDIGRPCWCGGKVKVVTK